MDQIGNYFFFLIDGNNQAIVFMVKISYRMKFARFSINSRVVFCGLVKII